MTTIINLPYAPNDKPSFGKKKTSARISIFGLGYVGLVSAACFADCGYHVIGVDPDVKKRYIIREGKSPIVEPGLEKLLARGTSNGLIRVISDGVDAVLETDISFVCVGTPSKTDGSCDLKYLRSVSHQIGKALAKKDKYHVVVFRSTIPPGTTRNVLLPILEKASGKKAGEGFGVSFHPEFLRESTAISDFFDPPKTVIGGIDERSRLLVAAFYHGIDKNIIETNLELAETVKYVDNTWHALKVSFSNEIGNICQALKIDSHKVMDIFVQDTKLNISSYYMKPGFAFGGSCLPKDVREINHLAKSLNVPTPVLGSIIESNSNQISHAAQMIKSSKPDVVTFLGITFKMNTDDLRESPILPLISQLVAEGIKIKFFDPNLNLDSSVLHHIQHSKHEKGSIDQLVELLPAMASVSIETACEHSDVIVVSHNDMAYRSAIINRDPHQRVVDLVRIFGGQNNWQELAAVGMDDYVQKPASLETLQLKINQWTRPTEKALNILLAEDEVANAAVIKAKLSKLGHNVRIATTGFEALRAVRYEPFDLIFMDIKMPEMCGKEATSRIRALDSSQASVPIVALTALAAPEESATYAGICW